MNYKRDAIRRFIEARMLAAGIYNRLYQFFRRYYQDGDFISQRRYSSSQRYAIPYNGAEVYLHWANRDQYYVKSDAHFRNYDWNAPNGIAVRFRLDNANVEQNNVKGEMRFFLPLSENARWDDDARAITIPFEYRPHLAAGGRLAAGQRCLALANSAKPGPPYRTRRRHSLLTINW